MSEVTLLGFLSPSNIPKVYDSFILQKINNIHKLMEYVEDVFEKRSSDFIENLPDEDLKKYDKSELPWLDPYARDFEQMNRYSFLLRIHFLLEEYVVELCRLGNNKAWKNYKKKHSKKYSKIDMWNTLTSAGSFITEKLDQEFPCGTEEWLTILKVHLIRNEIAHNGADIGRSRKYKQVENKINKMKGISIGPHNSIILERDFCFDYLKTVSEFLSNLYKNYSSPPDN
ncbi:hypothetical protein [Bacillus altitudinis]|uniref:hypothetical protein n=1 Tax=Bacillus altitudinis TaxID=293387 RepID=UPI003B9F5FC3